MAKEMTKREKFMVAIEMAKANGNTMLVEFFTHEIELLDRKKSNGNSKANEKATATLDLIYNALVDCGELVSITDLIVRYGFEEIANDKGLVTPQKVSPYLNKLVEMGKVERVEEKKKVYFKAIVEE
jgi:hypothetical protein